MLSRARFGMVVRVFPLPGSSRSGPEGSRNPDNSDPLAHGRRSDYAIPPGELLGLSLTVKDCLQKAKRPVVLIQGIEYLTTYNGFAPILRLIQGLTEANAANNGILLLASSPEEPG